MTEESSPIPSKTKPFNLYDSSSIDTPQTRKKIVIQEGLQNTPPSEAAETAKYVEDRYQAQKPTVVEMTYTPSEAEEETLSPKRSRLAGALGGLANRLLVVAKRLKKVGKGFVVGGVVAATAFGAGSCAANQLPESPPAIAGEPGPGINDVETTPGIEDNAESKNGGVDWSKVEDFDADLMTVQNGGILTLNIGPDGLNVRSGPKTLDEEGAPSSKNILAHLDPNQKISFRAEHVLLATKQNRYVPMVGIVVDDAVKEAFADRLPSDIDSYHIIWVNTDSAGIGGNQDGINGIGYGTDKPDRNDIVFTGDANGNRITVTQDSVDQILGLRLYEPQNQSILEKVENSPPRVPLITG